MYSIRLPERVVEHIRRIAEAQNDQPTSLVRDWILDRVEGELESKTKTGRASSAGESAAGYGARPSGPKRRGRPWISADLQKLKAEAAKKTPARVIAQSIGRTPEAVYSKASELGIKLGGR